MIKPKRIKIISCLLLLSLINWIKPVSAADQFSDLKGHWSQEAVLTSVCCDLIKGYPDKSFKPEQQLSQLEALVLFMKTQGYALDKVATAKKNSTVKNPAIPTVPWGQNYLNTAFEKQLLPPEWSTGFNYQAPATREQVAVLLGRLLSLPTSGEPTQTTFFSDLNGLSSDARAYIAVLNQNGIISGFEDNTFRPEQPLKRCEAAVLISKLLQGGWVKSSGSQGSGQLEGWVKNLTLSGKTAELELASLQGTQKLKVDPQLKCFRNGQECFYQEAVNSQVRVYLNQKKQVSVISLLEKKQSGESEQYITGSVKSILLGEDNLLILCDQNNRDRRLSLAADASLDSLKAQNKGFTALKAGTFVKAYLNSSGDQVVRVKELKTESMSGTVQKVTSRTLYFDKKVTNNKATWFNNWDHARIIDKNGKTVQTVLRGDKIQVNYLDPDPNGVDDEIPIEIINSRPELKKVRGVIEGIISTLGNMSIIVKKNKKYPADDSVTVLDTVYKPVSFTSLQSGKSIDMYLDGAGVVMKVQLLN